jgi:hypothetical protein
MGTKRKSKGIKLKEKCPVVWLVCYLFILLSPVFALIPRPKRPTKEELLVQYPRMYNGVSMTESKKVLNKNGAYYTDEQIVEINNILEVLATVYYNRVKGKKEPLNA